MAANTIKIEANKLAQDANLIFIQDDLDPMMVKHQRITMTKDMVELTILTQKV